MLAYLPQFADLRAGGCVVFVAAGLLGLGRRLCGRALAPEAALVAGWGAFCLCVTAWAVTGSDITWPVLALIFLPLVVLQRAPAATSLWRAALLGLPLLLVLLPARPSQVDTWLNLLPNLAFLYDHNVLPEDGGPVSWSFLPAAPYNTQFVGYAASLVGHTLVTNALSLFNTILLCAAGLHLARVVAGPGQAARPAWWACAAGLAVAIPLNPGFVPRVFLASYGEAPLAVTLMFAVALAADLFEAARAGQPLRQPLVALALVLTAMVEIKQSGLGLVLPFAATLLLLGLAAPGPRRARWALSVAAATAPALALYLIWRWYVLGHFAVGELKMLPMAEWHLALLPRILAGIAFAMFQKATYFIVIGALFWAAIRAANRRPWQRDAVVLVITAGVVAGYVAFLLFTYVAHFPAVWAVNAHSFFRYMSQCSLAVMLALLTWLRPGAAAWLARLTAATRQRAAYALIGTTIAMPLLGAPVLRFDLDAPQPFLWDIGARAAALLAPTDRVALLLPGDGDDAVGSLLRGVLLFTPPRRQGLDFHTELAADQASLNRAQAAGFARALVSCAPAGGLAGLPAGHAGLLGYDAGAWRVLGDWPVPAGLGRQRFSAMLPRRPFCL
jgi:hypothetical protein